MAYGIDWINHQILITNPQTTILLQDLINYIRDQEATDMGMGQGSIASASGKEDLGNSVSVGITVNLNSPWQLKFWAGSYVATISGGNLVGGLGGAPVAYTAGVQVLIIQSAASTIVSTGGSALTSSEHDRLMALPTAAEAATAVWDEILASHGITGTFGVQVKNMASLIWAYTSRTLTAGGGSGGLTEEEHNQLMAALTRGSFLRLKRR